MRQRRPTSAPRVPAAAAAAAAADHRVRSRSPPKSSRAQAGPSSNGPLSDAEVKSALTVLGLEQGSLPQIRAAWKKAALASHPDKQQPGTGHSKFLNVQRAHDNLLAHARDPHRVKAVNTARRANFDRILEDFERKRAGKSAQTDRGPPRGADDAYRPRVVQRPRALGMTERPRSPAPKRPNGTVAEPPAPRMPAASLKAHLKLELVA